jgi:hypothetical protein
MKLLLTLLIILVFNHNSKAQSLAGCVVDSITKNSISFANIVSSNEDVGVSTNDKGCFKLIFTKSTKKIEISAVGYEKKIFELPLLSNLNADSSVFYLKPKTEQLNEVLVKGTKLDYRIEKKINRRKRSLTNFSFQFGTEICTYIANTEQKKGKLKTIILSLNKMDNPDYLATYNIKVYDFNAISQLPENELYNKNIIIEPENKTYNLKINVDSLSIKFPKDGICIGVEILNKQYANPKLSMAKIAPYINYTQTDNEIKTWARYRNKIWKMQTQKMPTRVDWTKNNKDYQFTNAIVNVEVKYLKN